MFSFDVRNTFPVLHYFSSLLLITISIREIILHHQTSDRLKKRKDVEGKYENVNDCECEKKKKMEFI